MVVGVDAATMGLIEKWSAQGYLPNLESFLSQGVHARLDSVPNRNSAAAWSSMVTGVNPGKHGIFWFTALDGYRYRVINASHRRAEPIWRTLSQAGKRVGIINVPISYPADEVNGFLLSGIDAPATDDPRFSYPRDLYKRLSEVGVGRNYIIEPGIPSLIKANKKDEAVARLHRSIDVRFKVAQYLLHTEPWEFFMVVFTEPDSAQHFFWRDMAPERFDPSPEEWSPYQDVILDVYRHIDRVVGHLVASVDRDTTVLVVSDHGGEADNRKARYLSVWLEELGFLRYENGGSTLRQPIRVARRLAVSAMARAYREIDRRFDRDSKLRLVKAFPRLHSLAQSSMAFAHIDWSRTQAFADGSTPSIRINLRGREPLGVVDRGTEFDRVCSSIADSLLSLRDGATGRGVVERVLRAEEAYHGPYVEESPDLIVEWAKDLVLNDGVYDRAGRRLSDRTRRLGALHDPMDELIWGGHSTHGVFLMKGPGIRQGIALSEVDILDVTPTILYLMDQPVPSGLDGRVVEEVFLPEHLANRPIRIGLQGEAAKHQPFEYSPDDAETLRKRLKGLGYID